MGEADDTIVSLLKIGLVGKNGRSLRKLEECGLMIDTSGWAETQTPMLVKILSNFQVVGCRPNVCTNFKLR